MHTQVEVVEIVIGKDPNAAPPTFVSYKMRLEGILPPKESSATSINADDLVRAK